MRNKENTVFYAVLLIWLNFPAHASIFQLFFLLWVGVLEKSFICVGI
jgi:hypothetical protein